jgi:hypothetical protein
MNRSSGYIPCRKMKAALVHAMTNTLARYGLFDLSVNRFSWHVSHTEETAGFH